MNTQVRRKIEMAGRVRAFIAANPAEGASYGNARTRFEQLYGRAVGLVAQQRDGLIADRAATVRRRELRQALHFQLLRHLVGVGTVAAKDRAELARQFELPTTKMSHLAFLTAARGMLEKAEAAREVLVGQGMSEGLIGDLGKAVSAFEAANESSRAGRRDHVGAKAELEAVCSDLLEQVRLLDGLVRYRFGDKPDLIAAWLSAKHLPVRGVDRVATEEPAPGETPLLTPGQGPIAPAA